MDAPATTPTNATPIAQSFPESGQTNPAHAAETPQSVLLCLVGAEVDSSQNLGVGIRPVIRRTVIRWFVNNSVVYNSGPEEFQ